MERMPAIVYYVVASGHSPVIFDGAHGLRNALNFAEIARRHGFHGVAVGAGRGQPQISR